MKNKTILFVFILLVVFAGFSLTGILGSIVYGFSDDTVTQRIADLPYVLYGVLAIVISVILYTGFVYRKKK